MQNSHLISVLRTLSKAEIREFRKWLHSPVHNQRADVLDLFQLLMKGNHLNNKNFLRKEHLFKKIFVGEPYDDAKIRQTIHFLNRNLEDYLAYLEIRKDAVRNKIALAASYRHRNLTRVLHRTLDGIGKLQEKQPFRNENFYRNDYFIQQERYNYLAARQRTAQLNLQAVSDALDKTYIIEKLQLSCRMLFHQSLYRTDYDLRMLPAILDQIETHTLTEEPAIAVYYYILKAITEKDESSHFEKLRSEVQQFGHLFPHPELREIYLMAINYCIKKMNAGVRHFDRETFEWYRQGLENDILVVNQQISHWTYQNVVINALKLKEFDWADQFIVSYQPLLGEQYRENLPHFCRAKLFFEKKDYDRAMRLLAQAEYDDILINLNAKSMLLKMFYEQEEIDALESLLDSMRIYLQRKEIMGYHKANYQNILRYTRKLARLNPFDRKRRELLRQEIQTANPLTEREWLLGRLNAL